MKLLPTEAGARRRLLLMTVTVVVLGGLYYQFGGSPTYVIPQTTGPAATSKPQVTTGRSATSRTAKQQGPVAPQKLHLKEMEVVPEEPEAGRDPFRYGVHPPPPAPPQPKFTPLPPTPPPTPTPPPIPPIPLFLTTVIVDPSSTKSRAYLHDKNGTTFEGVEGDTIDGRFKLLKVGTDSVVMTYLDGSGQKVIYRGG